MGKKTKKEKRGLGNTEKHAEWVDMEKWRWKQKSVIEGKENRQAEKRQSYAFKIVVHYCSVWLWVNRQSSSLACTQSSSLIWQLSVECFDHGVPSYNLNSVLFVPTLVIGVNMSPKDLTMALVQMDSLQDPASLNLQAGDS